MTKFTIADEYADAQVAVNGQALAFVDGELEVENDVIAAGVRRFAITAEHLEITEVTEAEAIVPGPDDEAAEAFRVAAEATQAVLDEAFILGILEEEMIAPTGTVSAEIRDNTLVLSFADADEIVIHAPDADPTDGLEVTETSATQAEAVAAAATELAAPAEG